MGAIAILYEHALAAQGRRGSINGDGIDDLIVGALGADMDGNDRFGSSYVVFGGTQGPGQIPVGLLLPDPIRFDDVALGGNELPTLTFENIGIATLEPGGVTISGAQAGDFMLEMSTCTGAQLANGEFCSFDIAFAPTAPGFRQATLRLESSAPSSPEFVVLTGSNDVTFATGFEGN